MLRQFDARGALFAALMAATVTGVAACGIKGPLQPAPKAVTAPRPPIDNPATPPATTSPALPPPASQSGR